MYLDTAASALIPQPVLDAIADYYARDAAGPHRAVHDRSRRATRALERAREVVAGLIGGAAEELVFTAGTTASINAVAQAWARPRLGPGDRVVVTELEHHSNLVPWQVVCEQTGAALAVARCDDAGAVTPAALAEAIERGPAARTVVVALAHVSNALGTVLPVTALCELARRVGAVTVVDGAQAVAHLPVDVAAIGCDFYALSGHKLYGPTGIGALWGRRERLAEMVPYQTGGGMIARVALTGTSFAPPPHGLEAGTPNTAGAVGLAAAIEYLQGFGWDAIRTHERAVYDHAADALAALPGVSPIGTAPGRVGALSFVLADHRGRPIHPHDVGTIADGEGVAIRTGHHCAQPVMDRFGVDATCRASFGVYTTRADVDRLVAAIGRVREVFQ